MEKIKLILLIVALAISVITILQAAFSPKIDVKSSVKPTSEKHAELARVYL